MPVDLASGAYRRLEEIRPGSVSTQPVTSPDGRTLLRVGTPLNERYVTMLSRYGVEGVWVREPNEPAPSLPADAPSAAHTPSLGETQADLLRRLGASRREGAAGAAPLVDGLVSFRLQRVAAALGAALDKLPTEPEDAARLTSEVLFEAGTAVVGEVKTNWRKPFVVEKIAPDHPYHLVHPVRSALLAVRLGAGIGLRDIDLERLGTAAILMDVGMAFVPPSAIGQPGALDDKTRQLVQRHPLVGARLLKRSGYDEGVVQIVLEHHESWVGGGYPQKKSGGAIYRSARILNLAMTYVSLISDRPYRKGYLAHEAMEFLAAYAGDLFDPALVETMTRTLPPYPAGAHVCLEDGMEARVIDAQADQPGRPIVKMRDGRVLNLAEPGNLHRFVVEVMEV
jgi:HD-GYP domain-containing protein (c-di-GMP phosphodiesterase class II)